MFAVELRKRGFVSFFLSLSLHLDDNYRARFPQSIVLVDAFCKPSNKPIAVLLEITQTANLDQTD